MDGIAGPPEGALVLGDGGFEDFRNQLAAIDTPRVGLGLEGGYQGFVKVAA